MANIVLNTSNVTEIKYVKNGTTTNITEVKYKKGSSGSVISVWATSTPSVTQGITCTCTATNVGTYYHLSLIFKRSSVNISDVSVKLETYGTDLLNSSSSTFAQTFSTSFGASSGTWSKSIKVQKDTLTRTGFKVSYTDPIKGPVSYTGEFPITSFDWWDACPYIDGSYFQWNRVSSGEEVTTVYTDIQAAKYDCYVKLHYYLADGGTMVAATTLIGTSDPLYIPAGECDTIEKTLPKWYGGKYIHVEICAVTFPDYPDKFIYLGDLMEEDEQFYYEYLKSPYICTDGRKLADPTITLTWSSDYNDDGAGHNREDNMLYLDIKDNNPNTGNVTAYYVVKSGTSTSPHTELDSLKSFTSGGQTRVSTRIADRKAGYAEVYVSKAGFTSSNTMTATTSGWDEPSDTNT